MNIWIPSEVFLILASFALGWICCHYLPYLQYYSDYGSWPNAQDLIRYKQGGNYCQDPSHKEVPSA